MKNLNMESLLKLKRDVDAGKVLQKVDVQNVQSFVVENYSERRKKLEDIKDCLENNIQGIVVEVSGGYNKPDDNEPDGMKYDPIIITTHKIDDKRFFSRIKMDGFYMEEPNTARLVYNTYLDFIVSGNEHIERGIISFWNSVITDALNETCLSECGFTVSSNSLCQFIDGQMFTIIENIDKEVEGAITIFLPNEEEPSLVIVCKDRTILLSDDNFYIDASNSEVA
ncbi:MAG: hypothetical protein K0R15_648 [Clostridiales bacterium]|jgi:hypothetical protein|nr:hypothetical protein [Clostridiales bacterium]